MFLAKRVALFASGTITGAAVWACYTYPFLKITKKGVEMIPRDPNNVLDEILRPDANRVYDAIEQTNNMLSKCSSKGVSDDERKVILKQALRLWTMNKITVYPYGRPVIFVCTEDSDKYMVFSQETYRKWAANLIGIINTCDTQGKAHDNFDFMEQRMRMATIYKIEAYLSNSEASEK